MNSEAEWQTLSTLASSFVDKYYSSLANGKLFNWYGKDSFFASGVAPTSLSQGPFRLAGGDHIGEKLTKLATELVGCKISILQVDTQPSVAGSVFLSLWGAAVNTSRVEHFHHAVILAPCDDGSYYIRNDIFQFMPQPPQVVEVPVVAPVEEPVVKQEEPEPVVEAVPEVATSTKKTKKEKTAPKKEAAPEATPEPAPVKKEVAPAPAKESPSRDEKVEEAAPVQKVGGWAGIAASNAKSSGSSGPAQVVRGKSSPAPQEAAADEDAPAPKTQTAKPEKAAKHEKKAKIVCQLHFVIDGPFLSEEEMHDALGDSGVHLVELRQKDGRDDATLVFADFDADVYQALRDDKPVIHGKRINVRYQQDKRN